MKKDNGYWVDIKGNKWDCEYSTEKQAEEHSKSLINCKNCDSCVGCKSCDGCVDCSDCDCCSDCTSCRFCEKCAYCRNCNYCDGCWTCRSCCVCSCCKDCCDCAKCSYCDLCKDCMSYKKNPISYTTKKIGSRNDSTIFYYDGIENLQVICGCFRGNLHEFKKAVLKKHGNNNYAQEYLIEIEKVKVLFELKEKRCVYGF